VIELVEDFDPVLVANLLIAYGYAKWTKATEDEQTVEPNLSPIEESNPGELENE
jgi:hypothetical protein